MCSEHCSALHRTAVLRMLRVEVGSTDYAREQRWWVDPAGPVGEFFSLRTPDLCSATSSPVRAPFSVRGGSAAPRAAAGHRGRRRRGRGAHRQRQSLPVLGSRQAWRASADRRLANVAVLAVAKTRANAGSAGRAARCSLEELEYRCHARRVVVDVVRDHLDRRGRLPAPRRRRVREAVYEYATALLPPARAPDLPADLLALRAAPGDYPGWGWGAAADAVSTYKYQAPGYAEDLNIPFGQLSFPERVENEIDLRHLRTLGPKEREDKRKGAPRAAPLRDEPGRRDAARDEVRGAALGRQRGGVSLLRRALAGRQRPVRAARGLRVHGGRRVSRGLLAGLGGGLSGAARHLAAVVRAEARALEDEDHPDRAGYLGGSTCGIPLIAASRGAPVARDRASARRCSDGADGIAAPLLPSLQACWTRPGGSGGTRAPVDDGALATVTRPDLPDVLFRHVAGLICPASSSAATRGGVRLRVSPSRSASWRRRTRLTGRSSTGARDPYEPDEFLAPEGAAAGTTAPSCRRSTSCSRCRFRRGRARAPPRRSWSRASSLASACRSSAARRRRWNTTTFKINALKGCSGLQGNHRCRPSVPPV